MADQDSIWDLPSVQVQLTEAAQCYGSLMAQRHRSMLVTMGPGYSKAQSPIEAIFWMWWVTLESIEPGGNGFPFSLLPQHEIEDSKYRLDFAIPEHMIAVELDGHEFHEKTKEQVTYRNQRDRHLQAAGWTVFHFSGSELYRGQIEVVAAVVDLARARHEAAKKAAPPNG